MCKYILILKRNKLVCFKPTDICTASTLIHYVKVYLHNGEKRSKLVHFIEQYIYLAIKNPILALSDVCTKAKIALG
jgi:hypothetical protein